MKFGTLYSYWSKDGQWGGDYCALCHKAKKAGLDVLEVGAGDLPVSYTHLRAHET